EFASIYRSLGSKVTLIEEKERVLPGWDPLAGQKVAQQLINDGVTIHVNQPFDPNNILRDTDLILMATGRTANIHGLGLGNIGVKASEFIEVTNQMQVHSDEFSNIFAIGDVNGIALPSLRLGLPSKAFWINRQPLTCTLFRSRSTQIHSL